jgi:hypothetical protein
MNEWCMWSMAVSKAQGVLATPPGLGRTPRSGRGDGRRVSACPTHYLAADGRAHDVAAKYQPPCTISYAFAME